MTYQDIYNCSIQFLGKCTNKHSNRPWGFSILLVFAIPDEAERVTTLLVFPAARAYSFILRATEGKRREVSGEEGRGGRNKGKGGGGGGGLYLCRKTILFNELNSRGPTPCLPAASPPLPIGTRSGTE